MTWFTHGRPTPIDNTDRRGRRGPIALGIEVPGTVKMSEGPLLCAVRAASCVRLRPSEATNGTFAFGTNAAGQIVGCYGSAGAYHGFLLSGGTYTTINVPGAGLTFATGINNAGQIVGYYTNATGFHGFLYSGGTYTTLDDPLATYGTQAFGINDMGQIVGE